MLRECDADVVFLGDEMLSVTEWIGGGLRLGDYVPCPAVYIGERSGVPVWNLDANSTSGTRNAVWAHKEMIGDELVIVGARNGARALPGSWLSQLVL